MGITNQLTVLQLNDYHSYLEAHHEVLKAVETYGTCTAI